MTWIRRHVTPFLWLVFSLVLRHFGMIQAPDGANLDWYLKARHQPADAALDQVRLVLIDDESYESPALFDGRSPLSPGQLLRLIGLIAAGEPAVIAVDIDTSPAAYLGVEKARLAKAPLVWARDAQEGPSPWSRGAFFGLSTKRLTPRPFLGADSPDLPAAWSTGLAILALDKDATVRRHLPYLPTPDGARASLGFEVVSRYCAGSPAAEFRGACESIRRTPLDSGTTPALTGYPSAEARPQRVSANDLIRLSGSAAWNPREVFGGRIVLLGGSYRASRDFYATPVAADDLPGVEVWAHIVAATLGGRTWGQWHPIWVWGMEVGAFLLLVAYGDALSEANRISPRRQMAHVAAAVVGASALLSVIVYHNFGGLGSFLTTLAAVFLDFHYGHAAKAWQGR